MTDSVDNRSSTLYDLSATEAAKAIKQGALTAETYAMALLQRSKEQSHLAAFITLDPEKVIEAAVRADQHQKRGNPLGLLHGVPIAIKDSMQTYDLPTSVGTRVLADFRPTQDATIVATLRQAGAIVFGKNNLVEMSYGLTGVNDHHGRAKNPYDIEKVTGGSSSGAGASVAARIVPAAIGGDTVGSIRVPASFCGIVGFRPTTGRWVGRGIAPISHTFDTAGPMTRTVEDAALLDAVITGRTLAHRKLSDLRGVRLGFAPRQYLDLVDGEVEQAFRQALLKLADAGAEIVEVDLGNDFSNLAYEANWPIFFRETRPHVTQFLEEAGSPVTFQELYDGLGPYVKYFWTDGVLDSSPNAVSESAYMHSMNTLRPALKSRYAEAFGAGQIDALIFPTTPIVAPSAEAGNEVDIAGKVVSVLTIAKNTFPSSCAGLPGITVPVGLSTNGMPIGLEIDGRQGDDVRLLDISAKISEIFGEIAAPKI
jgi:mandelamide amidase